MIVGNLHARIQGRRRVLEDDLHIALDIFLVLPVGALFRDQTMSLKQISPSVGV